MFPVWVRWMLFGVFAVAAIGFAVGSFYINFPCQRWLRLVAAAINAVTATLWFLMARGK